MNSVLILKRVNERLTGEMLSIGVSFIEVNLKRKFSETKLINDFLECEFISRYKFRTEEILSPEFKVIAIRKCTEAGIFIPSIRSNTSRDLTHSGV